jgi:hypothetical protein
MRTSLCWEYADRCDKWEEAGGRRAGTENWLDVTHALSAKMTMMRRTRNGSGSKEFDGNPITLTVPDTRTPWFPGSAAPEPGRAVSEIDLPDLRG